MMMTRRAIEICLEHHRAKLAEASAKMESAKVDSVEYSEARWEHGYHKGAIGAFLSVLQQDDRESREKAEAGI
jgi:hypothetical protein